MGAGVPAVLFLSEVFSVEIPNARIDAEGPKLNASRGQNGKASRVAAAGRSREFPPAVARVPPRSLPPWSRVYAVRTSWAQTYRIQFWPMVSRAMWIYLLGQN